MKIREFISRLLPYIKPHFLKLGFISIMMILASALESAIPEITGMIIDELFLSEETSDSKSFIYASLLFGIITLSSIFAFISISASSWISSKVIMKIRHEMFDKLMKLPKSYFDKHSLGKSISKFTFDVEQVAESTSSIWIELIKSLIMVIILTTYLFYKSWILSLTLIILIPLTLITVKYSAVRMRKSGVLIQKSMGDITHQLNEDISGADIIKIYNGQEKEKDKFERTINTIRQQSFKVSVSSSLNTSIVNSIIGFCLGCVIYLSSTTINMTAGEFLSFFTAMGMLVKPTKNLVNINRPLQIAITAGESIFSFLDQRIEEDSGTDIIKKPKGGLKLSNVSFGFGEHLILNDINLTIKPGQSIGLVGPTGCGKSTLAMLITRLYTIDSGRITLDNYDINDLELRNLRDNISLVDQETILFNDTIRNNITLGNQNLSDELIHEACLISNSNEFISKLPLGLDTNIGDNGRKLSGGQRQRIAIARAVAKRSTILILDEATSSLDPKSEILVQKAIDAVQKEKTTIIIAHRLSTIKNCDKIIVLNRGIIEESGTHQELLEEEGVYFGMCKAAS
jgi:subfamily B ATP-binding cassette protein MsbA